MQSTSFPGNPEVEVVFETGGAQYQLAKRFSGQTGTTRLTRVGGETWQGDEAQARLAALLGVNEPASGRATSGWLTQQWSHLWVWQGQSGKDPSGSFAPHQADLLQQLQRVGGAVALQSELDGRVASRFSVLRGQVFTRPAPPRAAPTSMGPRAASSRPTPTEPSGRAGRRAPPGDQGLRGRRGYDSQDGIRPRGPRRAAAHGGREAHAAGGAPKSGEDPGIGRRRRRPELTSLEGIEEGSPDCAPPSPPRRRVSGPWSASSTRSRPA